MVGKGRIVDDVKTTLPIVGKERIAGGDGDGRKNTKFCHSTKKRIDPSHEGKQNDWLLMVHVAAALLIIIFIFIFILIFFIIINL